MVPLEMKSNEDLEAGLMERGEYNSMVLAMSYVPYQEFEELYSNEDALKHGTLFKKLNLPFLGKRGGIQ